VTVTEQKCITVCRGCSFEDDVVPFVMPFATKADRDGWEASHAGGAGHTFFFRLDGWPVPAEVKLAMIVQDKLLGRPSEGHR
jgi:hypothetical protein